MMDISPKVHASTPLITAYGGGVIICADKRYEHSIVIHEGGVALWQDVDVVTACSQDALFGAIALVDTLPEILLVGAGDATPFLSPMIRQSLRDKGVSVDVMSCGAACRTYNILVAEGRRVIAAIVPI